MTESDILTPHQISMANNTEPHEVLFAIHKRVVDTENLMKAYRNHTQNLEVEIGMLKEKMATLKEKVAKLEEKVGEEDHDWNEAFPVS